MVTVLFARPDSIYKSLPDCDVWDAERDVRNWPGGCPVVAHPPCRAWGRLRHFARLVEGEKELALWAVEQVRLFGGVLEHPSGSTLWQAAGLPLPGERDEWDAWTLPVLQQWWGHRATKSTWLYFCGIEPAQLPPIPFVLGRASHTLSSSKKKDRRPEITKAEREHTPIELAKWLVEVAHKCQGYNEKLSGRPIFGRSASAPGYVSTGGQRT